MPPPLLSSVSVCALAALAMARRTAAWREGRDMDLLVVLAAREARAKVVAANRRAGKPVGATSRESRGSGRCVASYLRRLSLSVAPDSGYRWRWAACGGRKPFRQRRRARRGVRG